MSEAVQIALIGAAVNVAVTWGTIKVSFMWLRADIDRHEKRLDKLEDAQCIPS